MNKLLLGLACGVPLAVCANMATVSLAPNGEGTGLTAAPLKVAVFADLGCGGPGAFEWARITETSPDMKLTLVDGVSIRAGILEGHDLLIMPGGSGTGEFNSLGSVGAGNIRKFVRNGGCYLGTCAGAFLTLSHRVGLVPYRSRGWEPQTAFVSIDVNQKGAEALGMKAGTKVLRYHGGPFLVPDTNTVEGASFEIWGTYKSDWARKTKAGDEGMHGAAAIVAGTFGKGKVFITSCHPEYFPGDYPVVTGAIRWLTGHTVTIPPRSRTMKALNVAFYCAASPGTERTRLALDLAALSGVDFTPVSKDLIHWGALDHTDVLILADANEKSFKTLSKVGEMELIKQFAVRGGKTFATGNGKICLPDGGTLCSSNVELIEKIKTLACQFDE